MNERKSREQAWLNQLLGDWILESQGPVEGEGESLGSGGTESVRSLGGRWILAEGEGATGDTTVCWQMTLGYDSERELFVGSWIGSMMEHLFTYDGRLDDTGRLTLETSGPDMDGQGRDTRYRDVLEFEGEDRRTLTSHILDDSGEWRAFMRTVFVREP